MVAEWYYTEQGQRRGPVTWEQLRQLALGGQLRPADLVWKNGMAQWSAASSQSSLFEVAPPPAPLPPPAAVAPPPPPPAAPERQVSPSAPSKPAPATTTPFPSPAALAKEDPKSASAKDAPKSAQPSPAPTRAAKRGMSPAMKLGLLAGCSGVAILGLCCGVAGILYFLSGQSNEEKWKLDVGKNQTWTRSFKKDDEIEIKVTCTNKSNMSLVVFKSKAGADAFHKAATDTARKGPVNLDEAAIVGKDASDANELKVAFKAAETQDYVVVLVNSKEDNDRDKANDGKIFFTKK
jgi:hypothetical protein